MSPSFSGLIRSAQREETQMTSTRVHEPRTRNRTFVENDDGLKLNAVCLLYIFFRAERKAFFVVELTLSNACTVLFGVGIMSSLR